MEKMLLKQGKTCNRNIKKMEPIQGNPCLLNRYAPCNICFCFDFYDFFSFYKVQRTRISLRWFQCQLQNLMLWYPVIFTGSLQDRISTQGDPCHLYREWVCSACKLKYVIKVWPSTIIVGFLIFQFNCPKSITDQNSSFKFNFWK